MIGRGGGNLHEQVLIERGVPNVSAKGRHAELAEALRESGLEKAADRYIANALVGTPERILKKVAKIHATLGGFGLVAAPAYGATPYEQAERSLELFGEEVLPVVRRLGT